MLSQNELDPPTPPAPVKGLLSYNRWRFRTLHDMSLVTCPPRPREWICWTSNTAPVGPKSSVSWKNRGRPHRKLDHSHVIKTLKTSKQIPNGHFKKKSMRRDYFLDESTPSIPSTSALEVVGAAFFSCSQFDGVSSMALLFDLSNLPQIHPRVM